MLSCSHEKSLSSNEQVDSTHVSKHLVHDHKEEGTNSGERGEGVGRERERRIGTEEGKDGLCLGSLLPWVTYQ